MRPAALAGLALLCGCSGPPEAAPKRSVPQPAADPRILHFYAYPASVPKGRPAQICYGVENAGQARIGPRPGSVPAYANRCVEVIPERTTEFVLTAVGQDGRSVSRTLTIHVSGEVQPPARPPLPETAAPARIVAFTVSPSAIPPGGHVTICYETAGAASVRIEPPVVDFRLPERGCFGHAPEANTTYRLTASGAAGSDTREAPVAVR